MVDIAIVDDDLEYSIFLKEFIKNIRMIDSFDIDIFNSSIKFLEKPKLYDIVLLDIDMPEMDGITLAKTMYNKNSLIIYITNYDNKMGAAFFVNVFKYITKDTVSTELEKTLKDAIEFIHKNTVISAKTNLGYKRIKSSDIVYLSYFNRIVTIYTKNEKYITSTTTFDEIKTNLPKNFLSINRNTIINGMYIDFYQKNQIKMYYYDDVFEVSRRKRDEIMELIFRKSNKL